MKQGYKIFVINLWDGNGADKEHINGMQSYNVIP